MEDKIKIAVAIAPIILQQNLSEGKTIGEHADSIAYQINTMTTKIVARLHNINY